MNISNFSIHWVGVIEFFVHDLRHLSHCNIQQGLGSEPQLDYCNHSMTFLFFYIFLTILSDAVDLVLVNFYTLVKELLSV